MATSWFLYDGTGSVTDQSNYGIVTTPSCPAPKKKLCAIFAEIQLIDGIERPIITPALQTEISNAINSLTESANVKLRP